MGLYVKHLDTVRFRKDRSLYIYLLDYGWPDGNWVQIFRRHFMKMADLASDADAVVIGSPSGVHFGNEVLNYHRVGHLDADTVLPGLLITKTPPNYFTECGAEELPAEPGLEDILVIPLSDFCTTEDQFVRTIERIFDDLREGSELKDFRVAEHDIRRTSERPLVSRLGKAIEVKPGFFGMSVDLKELFFGPTDPQA